jgi:DNA-directed RNA polymerase specialized sigma24 family protein
MSKKSVPPKPTGSKQSLGWFQRAMSFGSSAFLGVGPWVARLALTGLASWDFASSGIVTETTESPRSSTQRRGWVGRVIARRLASLGLLPDFDGDVPGPQRPIKSPDGLARLDRESKPERQRHLLAESLQLLDEFDRRVIFLRLTGNPYESVADQLNLKPETARSRYALALNRLAERLAWVAVFEESGISPPERAVLGLLRFSGRTAQEIAFRLGLPLDLVEHWIRLSDQEQPQRPGTAR